MGRVANYNPAEVDLIYGPVKCEGYAEGEFVTMDQEEDTFLKVVGTDGELARSLNQNDATVITFKLLQTSKSNALLSALLQLDKLTGGRSPQVLLVKDRSGFTLNAFPTAWIVKPPAQSLDKQATAREWQIIGYGAPPTNIYGGA
jgi:hypothetical protein